MDTKKPLTIGYSGSLAYYDKQTKVYSNSPMKEWLWTYNHLSTDPSTRSAFFLFQALHYLKETKEITGNQIKIRLWGSIDKRYNTLAAQMGLSDLVEIDEYLPKEKSLQRLQECDMLFLPLESGTDKGSPLFIPGKLFEYLHLGKPVLALCGPSDCTDILMKSGIGIIHHPHDTKSIASTIYSFIMDRSLLNTYTPDINYIRQYSFENITHKLASIFDDVLANRKTQTP